MMGRGSGREHLWLSGMVEARTSLYIYIWQFLICLFCENSGDNPHHMSSGSMEHTNVRQVLRIVCATGVWEPADFYRRQLLAMVFELWRDASTGAHFVLRLLESGYSWHRRQALLQEFRASR